MSAEWKYAVVDLATNSTTVESVACLVNAVYINTATSAHACIIKDDTAATYTIPASAAAGNRYGFGPTRFETSLVVDPDDSATGSITVEYVILGESHG
jgi:hypothetical protein